jgi:uncharacterized protein (TIGR02594 family)
MIEPPWLTIARADIGLAEIPGKAHAPKIQQWLRELRAWWDDDETAWCGVAVAAWFKAIGEPLPKHWYRARGWLEWGVPLAGPTLGCVVVYERGGGGHVGLVVGRDMTGRLLTLGGNQGNRVSIAPFEPMRVLGYRWPFNRMVSGEPLPRFVNSEAASRMEA